jgi:hypothetical protein
VRAGILYGFVVLAFEAGAYFLWKTPFQIAPVFFGLAFSLALIGLYPHRRALVPPTTGAMPKSHPVPAAKPAEPAPPVPAGSEKRADSEQQEPAEKES